MSIVAVAVHRTLLDSGARLFFIFFQPSSQLHHHRHYRSSDILNQIAGMFNTSQEFSDFVDLDDTHMTVMEDILGNLNPSASPAPGPVVADQLLKMLNWTRATTTLMVTKYDRSGHLDHGAARLRDIYENFCQGPNAGDNTIDRPKAACYMFAVLGIVFNEVREVLCSFIFIDTSTSAIILPGGIAFCPGAPDATLAWKAPYRST